MIKKNLLKTAMLGLCIATLYSGSAYATLAEPVSAGTEEVSEETKALYAVQAEIDKVLFENNAKEIERLGFMVNYTGVVEDYIEIGISPYNEDNANYIYELVGKDGIKVVEFDQSILYATGVAPDAAADEVDPEIAVDEVVTDAEVIMDNGDIAEDADLATTSGQAEADDKEVQIQIESIAGEEKVYKTAYAEEDLADKEGVSTPIIALAVAGGAALIGGAVLLSKKKTTK
jgi:hypothetical protein